MNKKAIAILGAIFLLIVGTLGFLIYAKYGKNSTPTAVTNPAPVASSTPIVDNSSSTPPVVTPTPPTQIFNKLIDGPVISPVLFFKGQGVTFSDSQGQLYKSSFSTSTGQLMAGDKQAADVEARPNINKIIWPNKGDNFIAQFIDSSGQNTWSFYDSYNHSYSDLPPQVQSFDWLPTGDRIYYVWLENGKATLNQGDPDTKNWKYIADMWETDDQISLSPDGKNILYFEQNTSNDTNPINLVSPDGKTWKTLVKAGYNLGVLWSPDSQKFLFGKKDLSGSKYQLWYYNLLTGEVKNLGINTIPDKAVWSKDSQAIYAAVPSSGAAGGDNLTQDIFYKVDTDSGDKNQYDPGSSLTIDGRDLLLSNDENTLFFKNAQDGALYYLNLNQ